MYGPDKKYLVALGLIYILTRIFFLSGPHYYYSIDATLFDRACDFYSLKDEVPHLPGYYLHIQSVRLLSLLTENNNLSMVWLSFIYGGTGSLVFYKVFRKVFDSNLSFILGLALLTNPMVWLFSCVDETYTFDLLFAAVSLFAALSGRGFYLLPLIFGAAAGIRLSSPVLMLPLYICILVERIRSGRLEAGFFMAGLVGGIGIFLAWFIPMSNTAGGIYQYFLLYKLIPPLRQSMDKNIATFSGYAFYIFCGLVIPIAYAVLRSKKNIRELNISAQSAKKLLFLASAFVPPLVFFVLFHYFKGYFLLIIGQAILLAAAMIPGRKALIMSFCAAIAVQVSIFLFMPFAPLPTEARFKPPARRSLPKERFDMNAAELHWARIRDPWAQTLPFLIHNNKRAERIMAHFPQWYRLTKKSGRKGIFHEESYSMNYYDLLMNFKGYDIYTTKVRKDNEYHLNRGGFPVTVKADSSVLTDKYCVGGIHFNRTYLSDITEIISADGYDCLYRVLPGNFDEYIRRTDRYLKKARHDN